MTCPACGRPFGPHDTFCPACGAALPAPYPGSGRGEPADRPARGAAIGSDPEGRGAAWRPGRPRDPGAGPPSPHGGRAAGWPARPGEPWMGGGARPSAPRPGGPAGPSSGEQPPAAGPRRPTHRPAPYDVDGPGGPPRERPAPRSAPYGVGGQRAGGSTSRSRALQPWGRPGAVQPVPSRELPPPYVSARPARRRPPAGMLFGLVAGIACLAVVLGALATATYLRSLSAKPTVAGTHLRASLAAATAGWTVQAHYCRFAVGSYQVSGAICFAPSGVVGDITVAVQATQQRGAAGDLYGIVLRHAGTGNYYEFGIAGDGTWAFVKSLGGQTSYVVPPRSNSAILPGVGQANLLSVQASGSHFAFAVNGVAVGDVADASFVAGVVGLQAPPNDTVAYTNFALDVNDRARAVRAA